MKRGIKIVIVITVSISLILWLVLSSIYNNYFWGITFKDWVSIVLTIIIGIIIAYILNEKNTNKKRFTDAYITKLQAIHSSLETCRTIIFNDYLKSDFTASILSSNKIISNSIELLSNYSQKLNIVEEFVFLKQQYIEFKTITTEYTASLKEEEKRNKASLKINLMINKLDEIELKLFEELK